MSNEISTIPNIAALQATSAYNVEEPNKELFGSFLQFLPRLQLFTGNSDQVKRMKIPLAHYGLIKGKEKELIPLGPTVLCIPLAWRAKAMDVSNDDNILAYHNQNSEEFKRIVQTANTVQNSKCMYGPEFLLWLGATHGFVTFLMGSKTARNAAAPMRALLPRADGILRTGILSAIFIEDDKNSWHGPKVEFSSQSIENPPAEGLVEMITAFLNPQDSGVKAPAIKADPESIRTDR